ncbi:MAG: hypothetical protein AAF996_07380 [Pseudomonadota bacterium]
MSEKNALDLSSIDPPVWRVMVDGVVYGPYTMGQMRGFSEEGRLLESSQVAQDDGGAFMLARTHPELMSLFQTQPQPQPPVETLEPELANYLVSVQSNADGRRAAISLLNEIGRFSELMPGCFIVYADISIVDLRAQLATLLAERGRCVIVNASTGQLAWMGLTGDADTHAKLIWKREP